MSGQVQLGCMRANRKDVTAMPPHRAAGEGTGIGAGSGGATGSTAIIAEPSTASPTPTGCATGAAATRSRVPLPARLTDLAKAHILCLVDEVEGSAAHLEVDALPPRLRSQIVAKRDRYERGVRALIAAGMRAGALRPTDATIATRAFLGTLNWTAYWFRPDGPHSAQHVADVVAQCAVAGLMTNTDATTRLTHADRQRRAG